MKALFILILASVGSIVSGIDYNAYQPGVYGWREE